jgi:hypothetical protein
VLRELDRRRLLGRHVYVLGEMAELAQTLWTRQMARTAWPTDHRLQLLIVSNEEAYVTRPDDKSAATSMAALEAGARDAATISGVHAQVQQLCADKQVTGTLITLGQYESLSASALANLDTWQIDQWDNADVAHTVILLDVDDKPVPLIAPETAIVEILRHTACCS